MLLAAAQANAAPERRPPDEIAGWIRSLGDRDFERREAAFLRLRALGRSDPRRVLTSLPKDDPDPERQSCANAIRREIDGRLQVDEIRRVLRDPEGALAEPPPKDPEDRRRNEIAREMLRASLDESSDYFGLTYLLHNAAKRFLREGEETRAEVSLLCAAAIYRKKIALSNKPDFPRGELAEAAGMLADLYRAQDRHPEAEEQCRTALEMLESLSSPEHRGDAHVRILALKVRAALAAVCWIQGKHDEAQALSKRILLDIDSWKDPDRVALAEVRVRLATLACTQARYGEAQALYREAIEAFRKASTEEDGRAADALANLALALDLGGKRTEAEPVYLEALALLQQIHGPESLQAGRSRANLGGFYLSLGKPAEAEAQFAQASILFEKTLGAAHPSLADCLVGHARSLRELKRTREARAVEDRILRIRSGLPRSAK